MITGDSNIYMTIAGVWMKEAYRPATQRQHWYVLRLYAGLADRLGLDHLMPTEQLAVSFMVFLALNYKTQHTVKSMFSTLTACLTRAGIDTSNFISLQLNLLCRSVSINKRAVTTQRLPLDTQILRRLVLHMRNNHMHGGVLAAACILMFVTNVRQSNVFPNSIRGFDPSRHKTWSDILWRPQYIKINIKWAKAQQKSGTRYQKIPRADSMDICLHSALSALKSVQRTTSTSPLIAFPDGRPIPISYAIKKWKKAMSELSIEHLRLTMHTLRRGGARYLEDSGVEMGNIAQHGGWRSAAITDYVNAPAYRNTISALRHLS